MKRILFLDERELKEIHHAIYYRGVLHHGTMGHNQLMLIGKMAEAIGFDIDVTGVLMCDAGHTGEDETIQVETVFNPMIEKPNESP